MTSVTMSCGKLSDADTGFMVMATTFVMLQTPALGLAQAGMIRRKNALSMLIQTIAGMTIGSLLWFMVGFSLTFSSSRLGFIGGFEHALMIGVRQEHEYARVRDSCSTHSHSPTGALGPMLP